MLRTGIGVVLLGEWMVDVAEVPLGAGMNRPTTTPAHRLTSRDHLRHLSTPPSMLAVVAPLRRREQLRPSSSLRHVEPPRYRPATTPGGRRSTGGPHPYL